MGLVLSVKRAPREVRMLEGCAFALYLLLCTQKGVAAVIPLTRG